MRLRLVQPRLFAIKTASVFLLALALVPLLAMKQTLPAQLYTGALVALHIVILGLYLYRVRFRELDPDRRSLFARVLALVVVSYMLSAASSFEEGVSLGGLTWQMLGVSVLHTAVLALLMVRVETGAPQVDAEPATPSTATRPPR
jgi:low temperature requirement protein LtrA